MSTAQPPDRNADAANCSAGSAEAGSAEAGSATGSAIAAAAADSPVGDAASVSGDSAESAPSAPAVGEGPPGSDPRQSLGRRGEELAVNYLTGLGLVVLDRNWRCREGELDIVATDGIGRVVFCEVKTRSGAGYGTPAEAVTTAKRRRIRRLAALWLAAHTQRWLATRFDVISIVWLPGEPPMLTHLEGAF